jgi:DNA-binding transcriptional MerR regulator
LPGVAVLRSYEGKTSGEMAEGLTPLEIGLGYRQPMASAAQAAQELPEKSLFRIGEVSRLTATKTFVLRYWESEFPALQPVKSPSGHRLYRREDIETVFEIKRLLYEEGFTIAGARKHLADQNGANGAASARSETPREMARAAEAPAKHGPASRAHRKFLLDLHEELLAVLTLLERE